MSAIAAGPRDLIQTMLSEEAKAVTCVLPATTRQITAHVPASTAALSRTNQSGRGTGSDRLELTGWASQTKQMEDYDLSIAFIMHHSAMNFLNLALN